MDREIRNRIQRTTQAVRRLLEQEFSEQLEGTYDVLLDGSISAEPGEHLTPTQCSIREKLVAAIMHHRASGLSASDAVAAYMREAAFTTLNRFVALKMMEARGIVQECVTKGDQSAGFREFTGLAEGLLQLPDHGYRLFVESIFDEIGTEVGVLFDRRDPASLLWPRTQMLAELLELLNADDLSDVWAGDETIGWVYQYFNGDDERKAMRDASQAPLNSRELAVRNQFFTPRYVVQFLVDNTLGRTWFEMMRGETSLCDLDYLVRRQYEVFLAAGEPVPEEPEGVNFGETAEHPFSVRFRAKKDPRDLKILDPACGSGHFLLYTFDLLITLYEEAWQDEASASSTATGHTLRADYGELESLRGAMPELILRHNLHGIDIDHRCAQIASLALWLRAQRAFHEVGLPHGKRPAISKTNIVVAEPMPGEADLRESFVATLDSKLGKLVERVFDRMRLAGEAGYLLRIADEIEESIRQIYGEHGPLYQTSDESEWVRAEKELRIALETFAAHAAASQAFARQLFANDANRGLGFIDVCSQRYDAVLMNPPFGEGTESVLELLGKSWPNAKRNLYIGFVYRAFELLRPQGLLGAITDATFIHQTRYEKYRRDLLDPDRLGLRTVVANGWGVLDAYVETSCVVAGPCAPESLVTFDVRESAERADILRTGVEEIRKSRPTNTTRTIHRAVFGALPKSVLAFWLPGSILDLYRHQPTLDPALVDARCGMSSSDNFRFYKVWWEVDVSAIGKKKKWRFLANGGHPSPLFRQQVYIVNWGVDGQETKSRVAALYGSSSRTIINEPYYFRAGLTFGKRTGSFTSQFLPAGAVFSNEGQAVFPYDLDAAYSMLAYLNTSMVAYLLNSVAGQHKEAGYVGSIPAPPRSFLQSPQAADRMRLAHRILLEAAAGVPESQVFRWPLSVTGGRRSTIAAVCDRLNRASNELQRIFHENDKDIAAAIGIGKDDQVPWTSRSWHISKCIYEVDGADLPRAVAADYAGYLLGIAFGRWDHLDGDVVSANLMNPLRELAPACPALRCSDGGATRGILVDDPGHDSDITAAMEAAHESLVAVGAVGPEELHTAQRLLSNGGGDWKQLIRASLFQTHVNRYSKSRRKAPIYWQLATPSASYSVWLYYHRFTRDTFFRLLNDYINPKLQHEDRMLTNVTQDAGPDPNASQRKEIDAQETYVGELRAFRDEVARVAPLWNPNLNDGVIINFAPLWRLVPQHKAWQKECKKVWDKLCKGDYDWAHLAMHLWPERVVPKCSTDRSLAIAHGLEDSFWYEDQDGKWQKRNVNPDIVEQLISERTSASVKTALSDLLNAPEQQTVRNKRRTKNGSSSL